MKRNEINYLLYEARNKKGVDVKVAAKDLKISKLRLSLIEHGYLRPSRNLKNRMIKYYQLSVDFFSKNSRHIYPINKEETTKAENKLFQFIKSKKCSFISLGSIFLFTGVLLLGFRNLNYRYNHPEAYFSDTMKIFREKFKAIPEVTKKEDIFKKDYKYTYKIKNSIGSTFYETSLNMYEKAYNMQNTSLELKAEVIDGENVYDFSYSIMSSTKNICIVSSVDYDIVKTNEKYSYTVFAYFNRDKSITTYEILKSEELLKKGSDEFNRVEKDFKDVVNATFDNFDNFFTSQYDIGYKDTKSLLSDLKYIAQKNTFRYRTGLVFLFLSAFFLPISLFFFVFSFVLNIKGKRSNVVSNNNNKVTNQIVKRSIPNDIRFSSFIPEFVLKIISILFVITYSVAVNLAINDRVNVHFIFGDQTLNIFQSYASTFLIGGVLLMFFIKLDINYKKTIKESIFNIVLMFVASLIYYLAEIILFTVVNKGESLFTQIASLFTKFIPGNIFISLLMYSLVYFFLFVTPSNFKNDKKKISIFRFCSLIPTGVLIFALIYKVYLGSNVNVSFYISCLFYTKSTLLTSFAILYLYFIFFYRAHLIGVYGREQCEIYFESNRYNMFKNIIASFIIIILFIVDLWFQINMPENPLKLGKNWAIIIILPLVLFYRSHIGKRNKKIDNTFQILYVTALASTYVLTILMFVEKLNLGTVFKFLGI